MIHLCVDKMVPKKHPQKADMAEISHIHGPTKDHDFVHVDVYLYDKEGKKEKEVHGLRVDP